MSVSELISLEYRSMNTALHLASKTYGASGHRWAEKVRELYDGGGTILDYGCGKGTLKQALPDLPIIEYDPAILGKERCSPCRLVICTDVMEHIEPGYLHNVLFHLRTRTLDRAFLVIATRKANKKLPDGRNAHLIVKPKEWWIEQIEHYFEIEDLEENVTQNGEFSVLVRPSK